MSRSLQILEKLDKYLVRNYEPLLVADHGRGVELYDADGNRYLDFLGAYAVLNVGHCHPRIVAAAKAQLDKLATVSRATPTQELALFCEKLVHFCGFGDRNGKVLPALGGHEAIEKAIKIARKWGYKAKGVRQNKAKIISCYGSFHGRTYGALSLMADEHYKKNFGPFLPGFVRIPFGDVRALERAIDENTVAFFVEPIQGEGGVIVPEADYLERVSRICGENNVILAVDEIQTGFGRTGKRFAHAAPPYAVEPDILIVGKGLGGGIPAVSAVIGVSQVMDVIGPGDDGSTFAGNPLGCAVALEAMNILESERLAENANLLGLDFRCGLRNIQDRSPCVKEIRGAGLMIGAEVAEGTGKNIQSALLKEGVLCGLSRDVLRFNPPLNITRDEINLALPRIEKVLKGGKT